MERSGHLPLGNSGLVDNRQDDGAVPKIKMVVLGDADVGKSSLLHSYTTSRCHHLTNSNTHRGDFSFGGLSQSKSKQLFADFMSRITVDEKDFDLSLWDTNASREYEHIRPLNYAKTDLFMLCYSVASPASLDSVKDQWHKEVAAYYASGTRGDPLVVLVGLKADARENPLALSIEHPSSVQANNLLEGVGEEQAKDRERERERDRERERGGTFTKRVTTREDAARIAREIGALDSFECSALTGEGIAELFFEAANAVIYPGGRNPGNQDNNNNNLVRRVSLNLTANSDDEAVGMDSLVGGGGSSGDKKKKKRKNKAKKNRKSSKDKCIVA